MNDFLKNILPQPLPDSQNEIVKLLRELMQSLALLGLWRSNFFEHAAFYGGTALRILYGLDRFSEDLDFSLLKPQKSFSFSKYKDSIVRELSSFGFNVEFEEKHKSIESPIESAFIKANTINQMILIEVPERITSRLSKNNLIKIKLEVDTNPPPGFDTEMKYVFKPIQYAIRSYTTFSLFAGKMHALLFRKWNKRVKGRDWYDFAWYVSNYPALNLKHLEERMRQSGDYKEDQPLTKIMFLELLSETINALDVQSAKAEVQPFLSDVRSTDIWSKDFFRSAAARIEFAE